MANVSFATKNGVFDVTPEIRYPGPSVFNVNATGSRLTIRRDDGRGSTVWIILCLMPLCTAWAKSKNDVRNELPSPSNLQAVVLMKSISLTWQWQPPEELPVFADFGYEIKRQDGKTFSAAATTWTDAGLAPGTYGYMVRARGVTKEKGRRVTYVSDWTGPVDGTIKISCPRPPAIELAVEPTQKKYSSIPSLRFHLHGHASVEPGCTLGAVNYHLDTGTGILHTGALPVDAQGRFDTFVNAFGPEDEIPAGRANFSITASAQDEAGPTTSSAYTVEMELENPYAPRPSDRNP